MPFWEYLGAGPVAALIYLAFAFKLLGFTARDELNWRGLMLFASLLYLAYYYLVAETPLWDAILTNGLLAAVNFVMIGIVVTERSSRFLSDEHQRIYNHFGRFAPGQFRRLLRLATVHRVDDETVLTIEGRQVDRLYFVHDGRTIIRKDGQEIVLTRPGFIGELAFLTGAHATATVTLAPGAHYLSWETDALQRLMVRRPGLGNALMAQLNMDLATKVATSRPMGE
ncbi:cyclic nucleotide-binding domain-containing protein [Rhodobacterales bacterium HKCCSP123]|nr:cyclic nucleotide-binding domain-containing protein [Rhodobacterales bacterium HKCCSP123]